MGEESYEGPNTSWTPTPSPIKPHPIALEIPLNKFFLIAKNNFVTGPSNTSVSSRVSAISCSPPFKGPGWQPTFATWRPGPSSGECQSEACNALRSEQWAPAARKLIINNKMPVWSVPRPLQQPSLEPPMTALEMTVTLSAITWDKSVHKAQRGIERNKEE